MTANDNHRATRTVSHPERRLRFWGWLLALLGGGERGMWK